VVETAWPPIRGGFFAFLQAKPRFGKGKKETVGDQE
jgi:hypothetical protein